MPPHGGCEWDQVLRCSVETGGLVVDDHFSDKEQHMLAELQRKMDTGEIGFVLYGGHRFAVLGEELEYFRLVQGQMIDGETFEVIQERRLAQVQAQRQPH